MRKLASIQKILEVKTHPNADKLDLVKVLGWQCVTKRDEFKAGDLVVYMEIDSLIPITEWSSFLDKNGTGKPARLKTVRLRKELSQGIVFPLSILKSVGNLSYNSEGKNVLIIEENVTEKV